MQPPTNSIDILIGNQKYELKGQDSEEHLREVADIVRRRVEGLRKKQPNLSTQKATVLAALDLASDLIKSVRKSSETRSMILSKAQSILEKVESEIDLKSLPS